MAHIYRAEICYDGVTVVGPTALEAFGEGFNITSQNLFLIVSDDDTSWALQVLLSCNGLTPPLSEFVVSYYPMWKASSTSLDPEMWEHVIADDPTFPGGGVSLYLLTPPGDNGNSLFSGGTLAIEKDEAANELRFVTPLGTMTHPLHYTGSNSLVSQFSAQNDSPLRFSGHGHQVYWGRNGSGSDPPSNGDGERADFYNARETDTEGVIATETLLVELSAADPGEWFPLTRETFMSFGTSGALGFPPSFASGGLTLPSEAQQLTNRYRMEYTWDATDAAVLFVRNFHREYRYFRGGTPASGRALDATIADEHGDIWVVLVYDTELTELVLRTTRDFGGNWTQSVIYTGSETVENPSIQWHNGNVYVLFEEGDAIKRIVSDSFGEDWGAPLTLAITSGTNPVHVVDQAHGRSYIFYMDEDELKVVSTGNFGVDLDAAVTIATDLTAQSVAAVVATDSSVLVAYILDGAVIQKKSIDMGATWS